MIGLLQRVLNASVSIDDQCVAAISTGLLALIGVEQQDTEASADKLLDKMIRYRIFADERDRMNRALLDVKGELLLVPQFTLAANTRSGLRPDFSEAAEPTKGKRLFEYLLARAREKLEGVESGRFGADMQVSLINDGPATFWLKV